MEGAAAVCDMRQCSLSLPFRFEVEVEGAAVHLASLSLPPSLKMRTRNCLLVRRSLARSLARSPGDARCEKARAKVRRTTTTMMMIASNAVRKKSVFAASLYGRLPACLAACLLLPRADGRTRTDRMSGR